jgi:WD40 repeat protein
VRTLDTKHKGTSSFTNSVLFASPDGKFLAAQPDALTVWELPSGRPVHTIDRSDLATFGARAVFLGDGRTLAVGLGDHTIALIDVTTWQTRATLKGHTQTVSALAATPDGKTLVSADFAGIVRVWDVP